MGSFKGLCDLQGKFQGFFDRARTALNPISQRVCLNQFQNKEVSSISFLKTMDGGNVRMIQGCEQLRLPLITGNTVSIFGKLFRQDFNCNIPTKFLIRCLIDFSHPACQAKLYT